MQIKNSFDKVTQGKILKGALIAMTGGAALYLFDYLSILQIDNAILATLVATLVPILTNAVKEWMAGESR